MERTSKPTTAGILNIISGALGILGSLFSMLILGALGGMMGGGYYDGMGYNMCGFMPAMTMGMGIPSLLISVLALVGGIFGVQRRYWGWALAGSIGAIIVFLPLGIASTVLTAQSKREFA
jgi:hypothetical protein